MSGTPTFDEYRTGYISEKHNVPDNAARALQLFELGFSVSGATKRLPVTESTVRKYHKELQEKIHQDAVLTVSSTDSHSSLDIFGDRNVAEYGELSYEDGVKDAKKSAAHVTTRKKQIDPQFREPEHPQNKGINFEDIPDELITIRG